VGWGVGAATTPAASVCAGPAWAAGHVGYAREKDPAPPPPAPPPPKPKTTAVHTGSAAAQRPRHHRTAAGRHAPRIWESARADTQAAPPAPTAEALAEREHTRPPTGGTRWPAVCHPPPPPPPKNALTGTRAAAAAVPVRDVCSGRQTAQPRCASAARAAAPAAGPRRYVTGVRGGRAGEWVAGVDVAVAARLAETLSGTDEGGGLRHRRRDGTACASWRRGPSPTHATHPVRRPTGRAATPACWHASAVTLPGEAAGGGPLGDA